MWRGSFGWFFDSSSQRPMWVEERNCGNCNCSSEMFQSHPWVQSLPLALARQPRSNGRSAGCSVSARPQRFFFLATEQHHFCEKQMNYGIHEPTNSGLVVCSWPFMTVKPFVASCIVGFSSCSTRLGEECGRLQLR